MADRAKTWGAICAQSWPKVTNVSNFRWEIFWEDSGNAGNLGIWGGSRLGNGTNIMGNQYNLGFSATLGSHTIGV